MGQYYMQLDDLAEVGTSLRLKPRAYFASNVTTINTVNKDFNSKANIRMSTKVVVGIRYRSVPYNTCTVLLSDLCGSRRKP